MSNPGAVPVDQKIVRDIKIKTGIVKRLAKEKISYEKESDTLIQKINKMREESAEEYYIKKQEELLDESKKMVTDCERRLIPAWDELSKTTSEAEQNLKETEEYKAALVILDEARAAAKK